jgi:hypothetical protein
MSDVAINTNPYHEPAGSSIGGRFARKPGGGGSWMGDDETRYGNLPSNTTATWEASLTDEERKAFSDYTLHKWKALNENLRDGIPLSPDDQRLSDLLDSGIAKAGAFSEPVTVYRGIKIGDRPLAGHGAELAGRGRVEREEMVRGLTEEWAQKTFQPGSVIEAKGFQSTSFHIEPAWDASLEKNTPGLMFEIHAKRGAYLDHATGLSTRDDEYELLLPRETRYRVNRVLPHVKFETLDIDERYMTVVQVEQL